MRMTVFLRCVAGLAAALAAAPCRADIHVYPRQGGAADATAPAHGPGVVVMGGNFDVDGAFVWASATIAGPGGGSGGDLVILREPGSRAGHDDDYPAYVLALSGFHSAQTVVISGAVSASDAAQAVNLIDHAEAVFFGGGDQRDYVAWRGPVLAAVQRVYDRGGVVGGTSAGSALWGAYVNDAIGEYSHGSTLSADAVADPFEPSITFTSHLFAIPTLAKVITDSHFKARDRFGRLAAFTARLVADGTAPGYALGVGVDQDGALVVDRAGRATFTPYKAGSGGAWIVRGGPATTIAPRTPLVDTLTVMRLDAAGQWFDFARECGNGAEYTVTIDGNASPVSRPSDPYGGSGAPHPCPPSPVDAGASTGAVADGGDPPGAPTPSGAPGGTPPASTDGASAAPVPGADGPRTPGTMGCACTTAPSPRRSTPSAFVAAAAVALAWAIRRTRPRAPHARLT